MGLLGRNTIAWEVHEQQTLVSHPSGGGKSKIRVQAGGVLVRALLQVADHWLLAVGGARGVSGGPFSKGTNSTHGGSILMT